MKKNLIPCLLCAIAFTFASCGGRSNAPVPASSPSVTGPGSPEEMAGKMLDRLKENDYEGLEKMRLTDAEAETMINSTLYPDSIKKKMVLGLDTEITAMSTRAKTNFDKLIKELEQDSVDLKSMVLKDCDYRITKTKGMYVLDIGMNFEAGSKKGTVISKSMVRANNEWKYTGLLRYGKNGPGQR